MAAGILSNMDGALGIRGWRWYEHSSLVFDYYSTSELFQVVLHRSEVQYNPYTTNYAQDYHT